MSKARVGEYKKALIENQEKRATTQPASRGNHSREKDLRGKLRTRLGRGKVLGGGSSGSEGGGSNRKKKYHHGVYVFLKTFSGLMDYGGGRTREREKGERTIYMEQGKDKRRALLS